MTSAIKAADLARHWGTSRAYVSKLEKTRGLPVFESLAAADQWRAQNAPPKLRKNMRTWSDTNGSAWAGSGAIDTAAFLAPEGTDITALVIKNAEQVVQIAYGLYERACTRGDSTGVALAMRNWSEACGQARDVREKFLDLQEREKTLIHIDAAKDVAGRQFQALRQELLRLDAVLAQDANPADPALAQRVIRGGVDRLMARLQSSEQVVERMGVA